MATTTHRSAVTDDEDSRASFEYEAWKRAKIEHGLEQSRDRVTMIPIEQVWRELTLER